MGTNSKIEWTDHTFNPWIGCQKVSSGCQFCYAETQFTVKERYRDTWKPGANRVQTSATNWRKPYQWDRETPGARVFCGSLCDIFEDNPQVQVWRDDLFGVIDGTPNLTWMLLTKRIELVSGLVPGYWLDSWPQHVWIGVSVENQATFNARVPHLLDLYQAPVRFLSIEPMLSAVDVGALRLPGGGLCLPLYVDSDNWGVYHKHIDWIIAGCESGPQRRSDDLDWYRRLRDECVEAGVPFFLKQVGGHRVIKMPKLDGVRWDQIPEVKDERAKAE